MADRDGYIPGVPCWIDTSQPDPEAAVKFYAELFGWECEDLMPADSPGGKYFAARIRGGDVAAIGSTPAGAPPTAMWNTYIWVDSADATASEVLDAGGGAFRLLVVQPQVHGPVDEENERDEPDQRGSELDGERDPPPRADRRRASHWRRRAGRGRGRQAAHSITSSARARREAGTARPMSLAVRRLMTSSNRVGCSTGVSAGFSPLSIFGI